MAFLPNSASSAASAFEVSPERCVRVLTCGCHECCVASAPSRLGMGVEPGSPGRAKLLLSRERGDAPTRGRSSAGASPQYCEHDGGLCRERFLLARPQQGISRKSKGLLGEVVAESIVKEWRPQEPQKTQKKSPPLLRFLRFLRPFFSSGFTPEYRLDASPSDGHAGNVPHSERLHHQSCSQRWPRPPDRGEPQNQAWTRRWRRLADGHRLRADYGGQCSFDLRVLELIPRCLQPSRNDPSRPEDEIIGHLP